MQVQIEPEERALFLGMLAQQRTLAQANVNDPALSEEEHTAWQRVLTFAERIRTQIRKEPQTHEH